MSNTYPNDVTFIIADDVIEEAKTKKLTIVGYYIGDMILLSPGTKPGKALGQLTVLAKFRGGCGEYDANIKLFSPSKKELTNVGSNTSKREKLEGQNMLVILKISPFKIDEFGDYKYVVTLDKKEYIYYFRVSDHEEFSSSTPAE